MNTRDELAELIASVTIDTTSGDVLRVHPDGETPIFEGDQRTADHILAAGYRKPRTITTDWELDALPDGVLVLTEQGGVWESIKRMDRRNWWKEPGATKVSPSEDISLPATILHEPEPQP